MKYIKLFEAFSGTKITIFDLDDTLILHKNQIYTSLFIYDWIHEDKELTHYLANCKGFKYIYTNGIL